MTIAELAELEALCDSLAIDDTKLTAPPLGEIISFAVVAREAMPRLIARVRELERQVQEQITITIKPPKV